MIIHEEGSWGRIAKRQERADTESGVWGVASTEIAPVAFVSPLWPLC
jgi:hypothetical protein